MSGGLSSFYWVPMVLNADAAVEKFPASRVLAHGPGPNRVAAREQLDAGLGQVLAFLGLGDDDQPCALQVRQTCRVLFVLRGGELFLERQVSPCPGRRVTQSGSPGDRLLSASIYRLVPTGKRDTVALEKPLPCSPGLGIHVILPRARVGRDAPNPLMPSGLMISSGSSTKMTLMSCTAAFTGTWYSAMLAFMIRPSGS